MNVSAGIKLTGCFVRCLPEEGCELPLPGGVVAGLPEPREGLCSGDERSVRVEATRGTVGVVTVRQHPVEVGKR